jgi:hypothetical protein
MRAGRCWPGLRPVPAGGVPRRRSRPVRPMSQLSVRRAATPGRSRVPVPPHWGHVPVERVRTGPRRGAAPVHRVHRICGCVNSDHTHKTAISSENNTTGPLIDDAASPRWPTETRWWCLISRGLLPVSAWLVLLSSTQHHAPGGRGPRRIAWSPARAAQPPTLPSAAAAVARSHSWSWPRCFTLC